MALPQDILDRIKKLEEKYAAMGQDMRSYLDGLIHSDFTTYWDYIHLDTLLSLQNPRTPFPDETIFIIYHQITELYFKLIRHEIQQLADDEFLVEVTFLKRLKRMNNYMHHLTDSFSIMKDGMDQDQFLQFRMALLPASGFQSAQYRLIELSSTDVHNLIAHDKREELRTEQDTAVLHSNLYWQRGATELATGKKTLTLRQFELKYSESFQKLMVENRNKHLLALFNALPESEKSPRLITALRDFDHLMNVFWPLAHFKTAARYLHRKEADIAATGGTNWQKYMSPKNQQIVFFPELWQDEEIREWGVAKEEVA